MSNDKSGAVGGSLVRTKRSKLPWTMLLIFACTVATCCSFWAVIAPSYLHLSQSDFASVSPDYTEMVRDLISGRGVVSFRYPPVFPLLLASVYEFATWAGLPDRTVLAVFILVCTGLSATLTFSIARRFWSDRLAIIVVVVWVSYPPMLMTTTFALSETPYTTLLALSLLLYFDGLTSSSLRAAVIRFLGCGLVLGLAMLTRPIALGLPFVLSGLSIWLARDREKRRSRTVCAIALLLGTTFVVAPWQAWMYAKGGVLSPLSTNGVDSILDGLTQAVNHKYGRHVPMPRDVLALENDILRQKYRELNSVGHIVTYLGAQLRERPVAVIKLFFYKSAACWYRSDSTRYDNYMFLIQLPYLAVFSISVMRSWRFGGMHRTATVVIVATMLWHWWMATVVLSILRYVLPAIGLLFVLTPAMVVRKERLPTATPSLGIPAS
jgi:4-amino-4-deoxy-L-arabinose transferase-like glycosyltransferase